MNFDKFTLKAQEAINNSVFLTQRYNHQAILPEHLLFSLIDDPSGISSGILSSAGVNIADLRGKVKEFLDKQPKVASRENQSYASQRLTKVIAEGQDLAGKFGDGFISSEHLLLAAAKEKQALLFEYLQHITD